MGKKEWQRYDNREKALELVRAGRPLSAKEVALVKSHYTGIGGLVRADWSGGAFFTPPPVVDFVHSLIGIREAPGPTLEPSIGGGAFAEGILPSLVTGIEPNRDSYRVCELCYPGMTLHNANVEEIFPSNGPSELDGKFDYCIGNPPFGLKIDWAGDIVGGRWRKVPSEWVFMEVAVRAVRPEGTIAFVVPDGMLSNSNAQPVRDWLMERCYLKTVISLPTETFFHAGTSVKCSVVYLTKYPLGMTKDKVVDYPILMSICEDVGWDSRGRATNKCDLPMILRTWQEFKHTGRVPDPAGVDPGEVDSQEAARDISLPPSVQASAAPSNDEDSLPYGQLTLFA